MHIETRNADLNHPEAVSGCHPIVQYHMPLHAADAQPTPRCGFACILSCLILSRLQLRGPESA
jgi:hypothetical protein